MALMMEPKVEPVMRADVLEMEDEHTFESAAARLISKVRTVAAAAYKASRGEPIVYLRRENARRFKRYRPKESDVDPDDLEAREPGCDPTFTFYNWIQKPFIKCGHERAHDCD